MLFGLTLLLGGCAAGPRPPREAGPFRRPDLVEVAALDATVRLDVRYAGTNNFLGRPFYRQPRAFLQRPAAEAVVRAHRRLAAQGYGLVLFDGYRPWSVTRAFWDAVPPANRDFVADPAQGSRHNRGCAVDCSLYDRRTGETVSMPSAFDEPTARAHSGYPGGTAAARHARDLLRAALEAEGFTVLPHEWWHFDFRDWRAYPLLDVPFERLPANRPAARRCRFDERNYRRHKRRGFSFRLRTETIEPSNPCATTD
jgi:zinc D-Ala-D-Ala dipeptidase